MKATKKIGLALGSGSARGWAHLGVLQALKEWGVPIHYIAGTSIGAFAGAFYAAGKVEALFDLALSLDWKKAAGFFLEVTFPKSGIIDGKKVSELIRQHFHETRIEDLPLPFCAVAVDVLSGERIVLSEGDLTEAIRASISVPGIFTPVKTGSHLLVDGGLVDPVPAGLARSMGADRVIAVDLNCDKLAHKKLEHDLKMQRDDYTSKIKEKIRDAVNERLEKSDSSLVSGIRDWLGKTEMPSIFEIIGNSIRIMEKEITTSCLRRQKPDVLITPHLGEIGFMDFHLSDYIIQQGYEAALAQKEQILSLSGVLLEDL
ncbi:MAG: patatin [Lentisphaerae bacterium]|nr:patatin [Lentisphaerota bacterium]